MNFFVTHSTDRAKRRNSEHCFRCPCSVLARPPNLLVRRCAFPDSLAVQDQLTEPTLSGQLPLVLNLKIPRFLASAAASSHANCQLQLQGFLLYYTKRNINNSFASYYYLAQVHCRTYFICQCFIVGACILHPWDSSFSSLSSSRETSTPASAEAMATSRATG